MVGDRPVRERHSRGQLLRAVASALSVCLILWACASNPPSALEAACEQSIASADELVVSTSGMAYPTETFLLQGRSKDIFAEQLGRLLSVDYQGFLWSGRVATARPGGSVDVMRNGHCEKRFVFRKSQRIRNGVPMNEAMEQLRSIAREGQPIPEGSERHCSCVERDGLFFWFGVPWEYEYVLRPLSSP